MKNFKRFLQGSQKLEALQITRKAKDVETIEKFTLQMHYHQCLELNDLLDIQQEQATSQKALFDEVLTTAQEMDAFTMHAYVEAEQFDRESVAFTTNNEDFQDALGIESSEHASQPPERKALPAIIPDPFEHDFRDITDAWLQRETEKNTTAVQRADGKQQPEEDSRPAPKGPLFLTGRSI